MSKNKLLIPLIISLMMCFWLTHSLVKVENERYALSIGMCTTTDKIPEIILIDSECLSKVKTRTSWVWHLFYALLK